MKTYKIYGRAGMQADMAEETIRLIEKSKGPDDYVTFVDMASPEGLDEALQRNIYYVPTVICEDGDGKELGFIENISAETEEGFDIKNSYIWWDDLRCFITEMNTI